MWPFGSFHGMGKGRSRPRPLTGAGFLCGDGGVGKNVLELQSGDGCTISSYTKNH